ncbi:MAG: hypothetical protein ACLQVL_28530 [Terriglobia bacterium]
MAASTSVLAFRHEIEWTGEEQQTNAESAYVPHPLKGGKPRKRFDAHLGIRRSR